jgi:hypothetical protein
LDSCRCWRCTLCPCKVRNKFLVNFWNRAILLCIPCIIRRMRFACWIIKATDIHSEYVTLFVFPRQQWLRERPSMLRYTYFACFAKVQFHNSRHSWYDIFAAQHPPDCRQEYSQWSACSSACGVGLSHRVSNLNPQCQPANESRLCQLRACEEATLAVPRDQARHHHVRVSRLHTWTHSQKCVDFGATKILYLISGFFFIAFRSSGRWSTCLMVRIFLYFQNLIWMLYESRLLSRYNG